MRQDVDVAIVGGGLAGAALAACLQSRGVAFALCDMHAVYPADFRAEKLSPHQADLLDELRLWDRVRPLTTPFDELSIARFGRIVEHRPNREYGIDYADLVNAIRAGVQPDRLNVGRVASIEASPERQTVRFGDGRVVTARLVVVATGLGKTLLAGLGMRRKIVQDNHCLAIGFDLATTDTVFSGKALTCHGDRLADRSAYLTVFPIGERLRANLFIYRHRDDEWSQAFCCRPDEMLAETMPGLGQLLGDVKIISQPVLRPIDLHAVEGHMRDGVVLIGDAFSTTCPTGGNGIDKVLTDVGTLADLVPAWLATAGMGPDKIARFYGDPAKVACDRNARRMIDYAKSMAVDPGLVWAARRYRNFYAHKLRHWFRGRLGRLGTSHAA